MAAETKEVLAFSLFFPISSSFFFFFFSVFADIVRSERRKEERD
jgi:hypothetical protein